METQVPSKTRIFFKDKQNKLNGPVTEREVQEGYRKNYFENSSPFYFMNENEKPDDNTEFLTLDILRTHNGIGCPFKWIDRSIEKIEEEKKKKKQQRINSIEKELAQLRVKYETVTKLQKRLEEVKKQLDKLPPCKDNTPPSANENPTTVPTVATATVPSTGENQPPRSETTAAASDDVMTNGCVEELEAAPIGEKKTKKNKKNKSKKVSSPDEDEEAELPKTVKKLMQQRDKKREDELKMFKEWAGYFASVYMAYLDKLMDKDIGRLRVDYARAITTAHLLLQNEEARLMCVEKIFELMKEKDHMVCTLCGHISFNYKQFFIHTVDDVHIFKEKFFAGEKAGQIAYMSLNITMNLRTDWEHEEERFAAEIAQKYASVRLDESMLAPTRTFYREVDERHKMLIQRHAPRNVRGNSSPFAMMGSFVEIFKTKFADRLMGELHEHIGTKLTYCSTCMVVTGTRDEYYRHLMLSQHLQDTTEASTAFFPTFAVNLLKKDLAY